MTQIITTILSALYGYLTSVWGVARMVFGTLDAQLMSNCLSLLAVIFLISIIDSLPERLSQIGRKKSKVKDDDEDEYEYIRVRKN